MASPIEAMEAPAGLETPPPRDRVLDAFTGTERILAVLPFVADASSTPRWHHLLFTEDKVLAIPAFAEPAPEADGLLLLNPSGLAEPYPSVKTALGLVAIPRPLTPAHVTAVVPYALVRRVRLTRGRGGKQALPELEIRAGRRTTWWFLQKEDETADAEKACYARDLLLSLLPFPVELVGFSDAPRPPEWHLRRGARQPLPLLPMNPSASRGGDSGDTPSTSERP